MKDLVYASLWVVCSASVASFGDADVADVTSKVDFDRLVGERNDVWSVVFNHGALSEQNSSSAGSQWLTAATELKDFVRFGKVNCNEIEADSSHAGSPCARAAKTGKEKVLGYSFDDKGEREVSAETYTGDFRSIPITRWVRPLVPRLQVQLTSVRMEQLGQFLKRPRIVKALVFPKDEYSLLVTAMALRFRQQLLVGQVKPTDGTLRKAFSVKSLDSMVVVDSKAKRHIYSGVFELSAIEKFIKAFTSHSLDADKDVREGLESQYFNSQSYSESETSTYPKRFDPWRVLGLPRSNTIPATETLKSVYKEVAKKWHPDKCQTGKRQCEQRMSETALAKNVLSDGRRLQQWEAWLEDEAKSRSSGGRSEF